MIQLHENLLGHPKMRVSPFSSKGVMGSIHKEKDFFGRSSLIRSLTSSQIMLIPALPFGDLGCLKINIKKRNVTMGFYMKRVSRVKADHREEIVFFWCSFDRVKLSEILRKKNLKSVTFGIEEGNLCRGFMSCIQRLQSNVIKVERFLHNVRTLKISPFLSNTNKFNLFRIFFPRKRRAA
jgi:hypothetical protein